MKKNAMSEIAAQILADNQSEKFTESDITVTYKKKLSRYFVETHGAEGSRACLTGSELSLTKSLSGHCLNIIDTTSYTDPVFIGRIRVNENTAQALSAWLEASIVDLIIAGDYIDENITMPNRKRFLERNALTSPDSRNNCPMCGNAKAS